MKGIVVVILIIGILAMFIMEKNEETISNLNVEKKVDANQEIVNLAKNIKMESSISKSSSNIGKLNELYKQNQSNQNISSLIDMAKQTKKSN